MTQPHRHTMYIHGCLFCGRATAGFVWSQWRTVRQTGTKLGLCHGSLISVISW